MVSSGARLGDHSDDMSRSMMGSQLERGNSSSTREVRDARVRLPPASLESLETRDRSEATGCSTTLQKDGRSKGPDCQIQQYIQDTAILRKLCMNRFVSRCFLPTASSNAASPTLSLKLDALSRKRHEARL